MCSLWSHAARKPLTLNSLQYNCGNVFAADRTTLWQTCGGDLSQAEARATGRLSELTYSAQKKRSAFFVPSFFLPYNNVQDETKHKKAKGHCQITIVVLSGWTGTLGISHLLELPFNSIMMVLLEVQNYEQYCSGKAHKIHTRAHTHTHTHTREKERERK